MDVSQSQNMVNNKKVKTRRNSIIRIGKNSKNLHQRQTKHLCAEYEKLKYHIKSIFNEKSHHFIYDQTSLNKYLIFMQYEFGLIATNINKPNIENTKIEIINLNSNYLTIILTDIDNNNDINNEYQILRYQIAYYYVKSASKSSLPFTLLIKINTSKFFNKMRY